MHLYKTSKGNILMTAEGPVGIDAPWDQIINRSGLFGYLQDCSLSGTKIPSGAFAAILDQDLLAPIESQEVWAAGVTYMRSRDARMEESRNAGGGDFYQKVYEA